MLTLDDVIKVRRLYAEQCWTMDRLAAEFGCCRTTIRGSVRGETGAAKGMTDLSRGRGRYTNDQRGMAGRRG